MRGSRMSKTIEIIQLSVAVIFFSLLLAGISFDTCLPAKTISGLTLCKQLNDRK